MRVSLSLCLLSAAVSLAAVPPAVRTLLDTKCAGCHQGAKAPAGIDLKTLAFDLNDVETYSRWVRVHDAVDKGVMPPGPKLPQAEREAFVKALAAPLITTERQRVTTQGRAVMRRLNRYEYENTVRELLGAHWLQLKDSLPEDGIVQRFNKSGHALDVSHVQMSRYMETAEQAMRAVLAASAQPKSARRYYARDQKRMLNRMRYSPFNNHPERATIPVLGFDAQPDVLSEKAPITVGPNGDPKVRDLEAFATPASTYIGNEYHFDQFVAPTGGRYKLRFNAYSLWIHTIWGPLNHKTRPAWWRPNREKTEKGRTVEPLTIYALARGGEKRLIGTFDVNPEPGVYEVEADLLAGEMILPDAARLFRSRPGFVGSPDATKDGMPGIAYRWMEVDGPYIQPDFTVPKDAASLEPALRAFVAKAYRRPATEAEIARFLTIAKSRLNAGVTEAAIAGFTAVLCSPGFLYLEEKPGPLNSHALASRLSYFLWNGAPDAELRKLAAAGTLTRPDVLRAQATRLLDSPRSRDFVNAFLDYWLDLRRLGDTTPDQTLYPEYYLDDLLNESALLETQLFVDHLIRKNLPARNLVASDFTMVNSHLAKHYGLPGINGIQMRQITLPPGSVRGGLLTQASVLKTTANGTTTSPVLRGVWIMERIVGDPPPPPPPNVPAVEPDTRGATTIREQLEKHRSIASCAACHTKIDPAGFALENFDVLGAWRDRYRSTETGDPVQGVGKNGHAFTFKLSQSVDASSKMPNGAAFHDIKEFKQLLLQDERQIARNMVRQFVVYATGAPVSFADRAEVERILDIAKQDGYRMRSLIQQVVQSRLFTQK